MTTEDLKAAVKEIEQLYKKRLYAEVEAQVKSLLPQAQWLQDTEQEIALKGWQVLAILFSGRKTEALTLAEQLLHKAQQHGLPELEARAHQVMGMVYRNLPDYKSAVYHAQQGAALYESIGDKTKLASMMLDAGACSYLLGDNANSLIYMSRALSLYEELGMMLQVAECTLNLGAVFDAVNEYAKAMEYFEKALVVYRELGTEKDVALILENMGVVYFHMGEMNKSIQSLEEALRIGEKLQRVESLSTLNNLMSIYESNKLYDKAMACSKRCVELQALLDDPVGEAMAIGNMGSLYVKTDYEGFEPVVGEEYLLKAVSTLEQYGVTRSVFDFEKSLAHLYCYQKRWEEAYLHLEKFYELEKKYKSDEAKQQAGLAHFARVQADLEREQELKVAVFKAKENILHKVLPPQIAERIADGEEQIADYFPTVSILFADIEGFTPMTADMPAHLVVHLLNHVFCHFDQIMKKHGCEKIKTIGDGYMAVAGAPTECADHAERMAAAAVDMIQPLELPEEIIPFIPEGKKFSIRIGIHTGSVVAGVVGEDRFVYDIYSDAVNTAARMESHGENGRIHVSSDFMKHLSNRFSQTKNTTHGISFESRGEMEIKGKGKMKTYFLNTSD
ncbi:MAG: tetratricopeptide repeat protein [Bacteroidetes bacterium]|nr:tetratricopeptide repeat protein [Bacteroidota bacterium]